jgi:hypothetical protein
MKHTQLLFNYHSTSGLRQKTKLQKFLDCTNQGLKCVPVCFKSEGRAIAQAVSHWLPTMAGQVRIQAGMFVVGKAALGQVFSEHFGFPCQSSFHQFLHHHHNQPELAQ